MVDKGFKRNNLKYHMYINNNYIKLEIIEL